MSAGASPGDPETVRVDAPARGIVADETNRAMDVLLDLRNDKTRLRPMHDRKDGIATIEEWAVILSIDVIVARKKSAAHHEEDGAPVRLRGLKNVERQRRSEFPSIDDIFCSCEIRCGSGRDERHRKQQPKS